MDPQTEKTPGLVLPKAPAEQGAFNAAPREQVAGSYEAVLPSVESAPVPVTAPPLITPQVSVVQPQLTGGAVTPVAGAVPAATAIADDNTDALDEEWINKAKAIVEQTKHDPHLESEALSKVKADYLRIRYNKHIKVVEEGK